MLTMSDRPQVHTSADETAGENGPARYGIVEARRQWSLVGTLINQGRTVLLTNHGYPQAALVPAAEAESITSRVEPLEETATWTRNNLGIAVNRAAIGGGITYVVNRNRKRLAAIVPLQAYHQ